MSDQGPAEMRDHGGIIPVLVDFVVLVILVIVVRK